MSKLRPLLEVQDLDLAAASLREKRTRLPEIAAVVAKRNAIAEHDRQGAPLRARRDELARAEQTLGGEAAEFAAKAKEVEASLYSGELTQAKELDTVQQELETWKQKQSEAEERELELLEQIEETDADLAERSADREKLLAEHEELMTRLGAAETAVDAEIAELEAKATSLREALPAKVVAAYASAQKNARLAGRVVAELGPGRCEGCRTDLPTLEYKRICDEPEDALVQCVHCRRLLIR